MYVCVLQVRAKETINQLKDEISNLSKLVEKGAGLSMGQETMVKELVKVNNNSTYKQLRHDYVVLSSVLTRAYVIRSHVTAHSAARWIQLCESSMPGSKPTVVTDTAVAAA
jgi:hypothetical protein